MTLATVIRLALCIADYLYTYQACALLFHTLSRCSAQAPGDEDGRCSGGPYPDTVRNLMDSYNYEQLLRGSGTGNPPVEGAVWTDRSVDGNDVDSTVTATYVSHF